MKLKPYEIIASALAALAAAAAASVFGVKGTLLGAAIGAAVASTVASLVSQSANKAHQVLRHSIRTGQGSSEAQAARQRRADNAAIEKRWRVALLATASALAAFVLALGAVTLVETAAGRSLSSIFGGPHSGTTVGGVVDGVSPTSTTTTSTSSTTTSSTSTTTSSTTSTTSTTTTSTAATPPGATSSTSVPTSSTTVPR